MAVKEELIIAGFSRKQAAHLVGNRFFMVRNSRKIAKQFLDRMMGMAGTYCASLKTIRSEIAAFPPFFSYKHNEVVEKAVDAYGREHADDIRRIIIAYPQFAGLNHDRVLWEAIDIYGDADAVKRAIMKYPPFAGHDHAEVVRKAADAYGDRQAVIKAILKYPQFTGLDHYRVLDDMIRVYGSPRAVKKAVLACPVIAGLNHARVARELSRIGRIARLDNAFVKAKLLEEPVLATYSPARYLAMLDVGRQLEKEGFRQDRKMLDIALTYFAQSPYVPGTDRQRISRARKSGNFAEPPLMSAMRKSLMKRC